MRSAEPAPSVIVYATFPSADQADRVARLLVEERLAACVSCVPVRSTYRWQGAVEAADEVLAIVKTSAARFEALRERLVAEHPYDVPEVIAVPITAGHPPYLEWLAGAVASHYVSGRALLVMFAVMATGAVALLAVPVAAGAQPLFADAVTLPRGRVIAVCQGVGVLAGLVGAGGAFLLVPLLIVIAGVPIRVTIGSSLAITAMSAITGFAGKLVTGQIPWGPAALLVLGAMPGAHLGARLSRRLSGDRLRRALLVVVTLTALRVWWDLLRR